MKTAIVHDYLNQYGGAERVLECLHQLYPEAPVYTIVYDQHRLPGHFAQWDIRPSFINRAPLVRTQYEKMIRWFPRAVESFDLTGYDLVLSLSSGWVKGVLTTPETLHICICTSPMRFAWDDYFPRLGRHSNPVTRWLMQRALHGIRQWDVVSSFRADEFIAISHVVARRIKKYYRRDATVIHPGIDC